jgi:LPXTG-motif cell wall-anchored protein
MGGTGTAAGRAKLANTGTNAVIIALVGTLTVLLGLRMVHAAGRRRTTSTHR